MTNEEIKERIKMTIDQYYSFGNRKYIEDNQLHFIGGVLQTALHLLPNEDYYGIKKYVYEKHGYDPGGCTDGQISMEELT